MTLKEKLTNKLHELNNILKIERQDYNDQLQILKLFYDVDNIKEKLPKTIEIEPYFDNFIL